VVSSTQGKRCLYSKATLVLSLPALFSSRIRVAGRKLDKPVPAKALQIHRATNLLVFWTSGKMGNYKNWHVILQEHSNDASGTSSRVRVAALCFRL